MSPGPQFYLYSAKMSVLDKMLFCLLICLLVCLLTVHWATECSITVNLLPFLLLACFVLTSETPRLLDILSLQMSQAQPPSPNQARPCLLFLSSFSLNKSLPCAYCKAAADGGCSFMCSEHYTWPWASAPVCTAGTVTEHSQSLCVTSLGPSRDPAH